MAKKEFYDWNRTLSHKGARTFAVFGAKNIGKTFGLRVKSIERYLRTGLRMCEIDRTKAALPSLARGYFDKIQIEGFFQEYEFETNSEEMRIKRPGNDEFETLGYFVALSDLQGVKKRNFLARGNIIFDEAVIDDKNKRYHTYMQDEISILGNIIDTVTRENELDESTQTAQLFLLGNSCDLHTPYLEWLGIKDIPEKYGYQWCRGRTALFHYPEPMNAKEKMRYTLAGQILRGNEESAMAFENKFNTRNELTFVKEKPSNAYLYCGIVHDKTSFGLWLDSANGIMYVTRKLPNASGKPVFYMTDKDGHIDYDAVRRNSTICMMLKSLYYDSLLRYDSLATKGLFLYVLKFLGVR